MKTKDQRPKIKKIGTIILRKRKKMKHKITRTIIIAAALAAMTTAAFALQAAVRIRFARGSSSTTVGGTVGRYGKKEYVVGARKGQQLIANVDSTCESVTLDVIDKGTGQSLTDPVTEYSDELPGTGDYIIRVQNSDLPSCRYSLYVEIQ